MFSEHLTEFHGLPVFDLPGRDSEDPLPEPDSVAWALRFDYHSDDGLDEKWAQFLDAVDTTRVTAVVFGAWSDSMYDSDLGEELQRLIDAADRFPALTGFFLADVTSEENEVSWIEQTDLAPLLRAYPRLEELGARGGHREFTATCHESLRVLRLESGGLSGAVVRSLCESELPALERLELLLGSENYGGDTSIEDLGPILTGTRFPALRHLGLMDSEMEDAIAEAVAQAPVVPSLRSLSLAMGVLTDAGAEALLSGQPLTHLDRLDLHHHFLSDAMMARLREALEPAGVEVDLNEQEKPHESQGQSWHYIAVSE